MVFGSSSSYNSPPSIFPLYLLPSLPFRRRSSTSTTSTSLSSSPTSPTSDDGLKEFPGNVPESTRTAYLGGNTSTLRCTKCLADLCSTSQIISKGFTGRHGRAYLVSGSSSTVYHYTTPSYPPSSSSTTTSAAPTLLNIHMHKAVPRQLVTGQHTVADISCAHCGSIIGWKYVAAEEEAQKYKIGKFILETKKVSRGVNWEHEEELEMPPVTDAGGHAVDDEIAFNSQDEDECEDLFAGVWSPALAKRRRKSRSVWKR